MKNFPRMTATLKTKKCLECSIGFVFQGHNSRYCSNKCRRVVRKRWVDSRPQQTRKHWNKISSASTEKRVVRRWNEIFRKHGKNCTKCKHRFPRCVYDLHHPKGTKLHSKDVAGRIIRHGKEVDFKRLLSVAILLCANCHRIEHGNLRYGTQ